MKSKSLLVVVASVVIMLAGVLIAAAQGPKPLDPLHVAAVAGTSFTYQGQLKSGGAPVNALCDFIFKLYDDQTAGSQIGSGITTTVPVTNGLFATVLDFGTGALTGDARWLDMQVGCPSGAGKSPLSPRQALTPAPIALALPGLWMQPNATSPNLIAGFSGNVISLGVVGASIGGGGDNGERNAILNGGDYSTIGGGHNHTISNTLATIGGGDGNTAGGFITTVGGGQQNIASGFIATVGGGQQNIASNTDATVGGGSSNSASGWNSTVSGGYTNRASYFYATVGGGYFNSASGSDATVGGGKKNIASGSDSTVGGGESNTASGDLSFAAGRLAKANDQGAFVWADSNNFAFNSGGVNQFDVRATGGISLVTNVDGSGNPLAGLLVTSAGNVGIGTTAPGVALHVAHDTLYDTGASYAIVAGSASYPGKRLNLGYDAMLNAGVLQASEEGVSFNRNLLLNPNAGNVGIGVTNTVPVKLTVAGDLRLGTAGSNGCVQNFAGSGLVGSCSSDVRLKKDIVVFPSLLARVAQLQPVHYTWRADEFPDYHFVANTPSAGLIAQDVERLFPELVGTDERGFKTVNYSELPLLLLQALKELRAEQVDEVATLKAQNAAQRSEIAALQQQNTSIEARLNALEHGSNAPVHAEAGSMPPSWLLFGGLIVVGVAMARTRVVRATRD